VYGFCSTCSMEHAPIMHCTRRVLKRLFREY